MKEVKAFTQELMLPLHSFLIKAMLALQGLNLKAHPATDWRMSL